MKCVTTIKKLFICFIVANPQQHGFTLHNAPIAFDVMIYTLTSCQVIWVFK